MFCSNCGKEINDEALICVHCGCGTANYKVNNNTTANEYIENKSMAATILLWLFLGGFGAHRFYLGYTGSGVVMLICLLLSWLVIPGIILIVWWIVDIILLVSGSLKPANGGKLI